NEYVQTCRVDENVRYGIHVKICLGLELTSYERDWLVRKGRTSAANLDRYCNQYYSNSHGLI
ncbi:MAG TPA: hypothetical protein PKO06_13420, partial [Candidatus Ozemobacteraceae bacterium]|nr:hypothetical protein [Candidatus Ozemobacteraceae bacterium]